MKMLDRFKRWKPFPNAPRPARMALKATVVIIVLAVIWVAVGGLIQWTFSDIPVME